ncbi:MAG: prenyltransferase [Pyrinomonadaceae bacterium]
MPNPRFFFKVSRPRFWIYLFGPYLIGLVAGADSIAELTTATAIIFGLYFLFPANLLVYGINDIFDFETDVLNEKKAGYELLVTPDKRLVLAAAIAVVTVPFVVAAMFTSLASFLTLVAFLLLSIFYSAPPARAKGIPILDSAFNGLYVLPGVFAYQITAGTFPPLVVVVAGWFWTMAMHAYSAVPDIDADHRAGVRTIATFLGSTSTVVFCLVAYLAAALLIMTEEPALGVSLGVVYTTLMLISLAVGRRRSGLFPIYRIFPLVNTLCGFAIFCYVALTRHF